MPTSRRTSLRTSAAHRDVTVAVTLAVALAVAGCAAPRPVPSRGPSTSPSAATTAAPADVPPAMIIRADLEGGVRWWATPPGDPLSRRALRVPGDARLGPAAVDGSILLTTSSNLVLTHLAGDEMATVRTVDLLARGAAPSVPGCLSAGGAAVVADADTFQLGYVAPDGEVETLAFDLTLGECAWLDDDILLFVVEGGGLGTWDRASGPARPIADARGRHPSAGGGLLSLVDGSAGHPVAVLREARLMAGDPATLGAERWRIAAGGDELITNAQLSPDGGWLAVEVVVGPEGASARRLRLYRLTETGPEPVVDVPLGDREQVALLPAGIAAPRPGRDP